MPPGPCEDVGLRDRVVVEVVLGDVDSGWQRRSSRSSNFSGARVDGEKDVLARAGDLAEGGDDDRLVGIADVVLVAFGHVGAVTLRLQHHVGRIDVGAVLLLGEAEGEDPALCRCWAVFFLTASFRSSRSDPARGSRPARCTSRAGRRSPGFRCISQFRQVSQRPSPRRTRG